MGCFSSTLRIEDKQLVEAVRLNNTDEVERLISNGANVNYVISKIEKDTFSWKRVTLLMLAADKGYLDCLEVLLKHGADVNAVSAGGCTALMPAAIEGHVDCLEVLVKHGADVNVAANNGDTALILTAIEGHVDCVEVLVKHGADVNVAANNGDTASMEAAYNGHVDCIEVLVKHGADVNAANADGRTALMMAAGHGHVDCVEVLVKHGADVNVAANNGDTALMMAAGHGHVDCVEVLVKHGADVNVLNNNGNTALILTAYNGHVDCVEILLKHVDETSQIEDALSVTTQKKIEKLLQRHLTLVEQGRFQVTLHSDKTSATKASGSRKTSRPNKTSNNYFSGSSVPPPLVWTSTAANSIPRPTAPVQTMQPEARAAPSAPAMVLAPSPGQSRDISHQGWIIPFDELQLGTLLGRGSYAEVYRATWHGTEVAAKRFTLPSGSTDSEAEFSTTLLTKIKSEADLLATIRHPHVVSFLGMCSDPPCMVTELCSQGSLFDAMRRCKSDPNLAANFTWKQRLDILIDAAAGMLHLHQRTPQILHRDLKSLNLLVDSAWRAKIADLGLSKLLEEATTETHAGSTASNMNARWLAPEVLETGKWLPASDVYSFGVVMWELLTWELPWNHINQFMVR